jgi:hypothetical protein
VSRFRTISVSAVPIRRVSDEAVSSSIDQFN